MPAEEPKNFARRDLLISLQKSAREIWEKERIFEEDAPEEGTMRVPDVRGSDRW